MSAQAWPAPLASKADQDWAGIAATAPTLAATMARYLEQLGTVLAPTSVEVADNTLRQLARWLLAETQVRSVREVQRAPRGLQALARRPPRHDRQTVGHQHPTSTPADAAHVLRTDHRVGLARRATPQPDHHR
jgi:hypothetical protein